MGRPKIGPCKSGGERQWQHLFGSMPRYFYSVFRKAQNIFESSTVPVNFIKNEVSITCTKNPKNCERELLSSCRSKGKPNVCRYHAPWKDRMWYGKPLVVCRKFAKKHKLPCSGPRNVLVKFTDTWLKRTMKGLILACNGSNTSVVPSDRLPIIPEVHENSIGFSGCAKPKNVAKPCCLL